MTHEDYLKQAILIAEEGVQGNIGGPFGAIVVKDGKIIASACNAVRSSNDPTAHAEILAIRRACEKLKSHQLEGCILYSSCEPCPMCLGAIYWARPKAVYFAAKHSDAAKSGFDDTFIYEQIQLQGEERSIPFHQLKIKEQLSPFNTWDIKNDKADY